MTTDNEGLPEGFVPAFTFIRTQDGVVEYVHPAGEVLTRGPIHLVAAQDVQVGDVLVVPEGEYAVTQIDAWDLTNGKPVYPPYQQGGPGWPVLRILTTAKGYARFPHETVTVTRAFDV